MSFLLAFFAGVTIHIALFNRGEWHMKGPRVLFCHVFCAVVTTFLEVRQNFCLRLFPYNSIGLIACYLWGIFISIITYRLSSPHHLHRFPGPRLAAISTFWHVWQCRDSRNHELMCKLHEQYGDVVRIGMILP